MKFNSFILAIETSCDETAIALLSATQIQNDNPTSVIPPLAESRQNSWSGDILSHKIQSQIEIHRPFGGVFPNMAKREHIRNILPLIKETLETLEEMDDFYGVTIHLSDEQKQYIIETCKHEDGFADMLIEFIQTTPKPSLTYIAITTGPGLMPALWVGVNTAKVLGMIWNIPVRPVNHMMGHLLSVQSTLSAFTLTPHTIPSVALLVSGGHTEIIAITEHGYEKIGKTLDDALGESFDKAARMLGLPYPGGPEIGKLAQEYIETQPNIISDNVFPRPMKTTVGYDVSYSGLKTSVKYYIEKNPTVDHSYIAYEFQEAALETILYKLFLYLQSHDCEELIVAGGVAASPRLREKIQEGILKYGLNCKVSFPVGILATDNAVMIGVASLIAPDAVISDIVAQGNMSL